MQADLRAQAGTGVAGGTGNLIPLTGTALSSTRAGSTTLTAGAGELGVSVITAVLSGEVGDIVAAPVVGAAEVGPGVSDDLVSFGGCMVGTAVGLAGVGAVARCVWLSCQWWKYGLAGGIEVCQKMDCSEMGAFSDM